MSSTSRLRFDTTAAPETECGSDYRTDTRGTDALGPHRLGRVGADPAGVDPEPDRHRD
jgi:hypothetical protein